MGEQCRHCGKKLEHVPGYRKKTFCNNGCRMAYWQEHPEGVKRKTQQVKCVNCGREFECHVSSGRIYCSHACYIEMRYVKKENYSAGSGQRNRVQIMKLPPAPESPTALVLSSHTSISPRVDDFPEPRRIWLICGATLFAGKIDHFAANIPPEIGEGLQEEDAFVFCNRQRDLLSLLQWQGDGFALYYKRLEYGKYPWPPERKGARIAEISPKDFALLLAFPDFLARCERGDFSPLAQVEMSTAQMLFWLSKVAILLCFSCVS